MVVQTSTCFVRIEHVTLWLKIRWNADIFLVEGDSNGISPSRAGNYKLRTHPVRCPDFTYWIQILWGRKFIEVCLILTTNKMIYAWKI
jgi:hypothetical protein